MPALPSLRQLEYLVAVARRLNFTQAAADCFVTQSTLSAGIRELESTLGAPMLERDRQRVMLTPVGAEVFARAEQLLAAAADLSRLVISRSDPLAGEVSIGAIPTIAPFFLPPLLRALRAPAPGLRVLLRERTTADLLRRVRDGEIDYALVALPYDLADLKFANLFDEALWLVAPAREFNAAMALRDVPPDRLLLLEEGHCLREHTLAACPAQPSNRELEASSLFTLVQMVEEGWGYAVLPEMAISGGALEHTRLAARRLPSPAPSRGIALVARRSDVRPQLFDLLAELAKGCRSEVSEGGEIVRGQSLKSGKKPLD